MDWRSLPKVELHLHLDISLSYAGAAQLSPALTQAEFARDFVAPVKCTNLLDFLNRTPRVLELLQTERGLSVLPQDVFRQLADDHVIYAELRFAPLLHTRQGLTPREVVQTVEAAVERCSKDSGIESRLILCSLRHFTAGESLQTVQLVEAFKGSRVAGFDLAGDEAGYPLTAHLEAFAYTKDHHIPITSHAGEAAGAPSVWDTLRLIGPSRIGHGVRCIEDPALVAYLKEKQIHLESCPTCNVQLDVFPTYADHSIDPLYRQGLSLSISTDNRTLTPITLSEEYAKLAATFGWGKRDFLKCNLDAVQAAFIPPAVQADLARRITQAYS